MSARKIKRSPWFKPSQKPARPGLYEAQDTSMRCNCCVLMLEWRGGEWFSNSNLSGLVTGYRTHFFTSQLRRWRGITKEQTA